MKRRTCGIALMLAVALVWLSAPTFGEVGANTAQVGEPAPVFELVDVVTDETTSLADYRGDKLVVVTFQSVKCPWNWMRPEAGYERVLSPMAAEYADKGVQFLSINSNKSESIETLKEYQAKHQLSYPILKDPGNKVADAYNARTTPHFYVIDKEGVLRYIGGFEQPPTNPAKCGEMEEQYLRPVLDALLAGEEPPMTQTKSIGCTIERG